MAAHLIVGPHDEPFLPALLESIAGACRMLIVNDNSPDPSPHADALQRSRFGRENRLVVNRAPFSNFADARNICLRLHGELRAGEWVAFVDADEVHGETVNRIARNLHRAPPNVDFIEGYTWHFFASPDWYMSIERRMSFFRYGTDVRWEGAVHEQLRGLRGERLVLPYVYAHYGWIMPVRRHALKGRQYAGLGAPGETVPEERIDDVALDTYFEYAGRWQHALRFGGRHPRAARAVIESLRRERAQEFALADELVRKNQGLGRRIGNALMKLNYEQRWRLRALNPSARGFLEQ
ncbi:MAG TPA: glycosyltransferase [Candidatus Baltobacteraceae bacterium]|nr:glycosyltransferase [Candidatus Baltobacteraceae bacterium]